MTNRPHQHVFRVELKPVFTASAGKVTLLICLRALLQNIYKIYILKDPGSIKMQRCVFTLI